MIVYWFSSNIAKVTNTEEQSVVVIILCTDPPVVSSPVGTIFVIPCSHVLSYMEGEILYNATSTR